MRQHYRTETIFVLLGKSHNHRKGYVAIPLVSFTTCSLLLHTAGSVKVNAAIAAQVLIDTFHVDAIFNGGTAGGMDKNVQLLHTVISDRIMYHDAAEGVLTKFHPWLENNYFEADRNLLEAAKNTSSPPAIPYILVPWSPENNLLWMTNETVSISDMLPSV